MAEQKTTISKGSYVTIGVVVLIVGVTMFITKTAADLSSHIEDPALHHNITSLIRESYVTRPELDSRFGSIDDELRYIREGLDEVLKELRKNN